MGEEVAWERGGIVAGISMMVLRRPVDGLLLKHAFEKVIDYIT
jgi:hypothetical protein